MSGRPLTGSVRFRNGKWHASLPRGFGKKGRLEPSFDTEAEAQAWVAEQLARIAKGLAPEMPACRRPPAPAKPPRRDRTGASEDLETIGRRWHTERYLLMEAGDEDRSQDVLRDLELHVFSNFADLFDCDRDEGRRRIIVWLRAMAGRPAPEGTPWRPPSPRRAAQATASQYLWLLREVLAFARELDPTIPDYAAGKHIKAMKRVGAKKRKTELVSLADTAAIAAHLHVVHQTVLWLLRLAGLRISECYGLRVGRFVVDDDGDGFLLVRAQGGRAFRTRDGNGDATTVTHVESGKTDAAYRLIALPAMLTALIVKVIAAYHTGPDGAIDVGARLIPTIRSAGGGQHGFRSALAAASKTARVDYGDPESAFVVPHAFRKAYGSDLAWDNDISPLLARRLMGHRAGSDVFDLVYTLDSRLKAHLMPAAHALDTQLAEAGVTLMVPTARRPLYGTDLDPERVAFSDGVLEAAGWQVNPRGDLITTDEAATHLGRSPQATRRLFPDTIPAVRGADGWLAALDDVLAFRDRLVGHRLVPDLAEEAGVDYHSMHRTIKRLGIIPGRDAHSSMLLLSDAQAAELLGEFRRLDALQERSMTVAAAAARFPTSHSMVNAWCRSGRLAYDDERDAAGARYVTRASVDAELARRGRKTRPTVSVSALAEVSGLDAGAIAALVAAGRLVRARGELLTLESVQAWATGYRPDLLSWKVLRAAA